MNALIGRAEGFVRGNTRVLSYLAVFAIIAVALAFYIHGFKGINIDYDDYNYAYFAEYPASILSDYFYAASMGFVVVGQPFYYIFQNNMILAPAAGITTTAVTIFAIFMIGMEYGMPSVGILAALLYAFNPMIYTYAPHFLPENYLMLLLAVAILLLVKAGKAAEARKRFRLLVCSGFVLGLGVFFGVQGFITMLGYGVLVLAQAFYWKEKRWARDAFIGVVLALALFCAVQLFFYHDPFRGVVDASQEMQKPNRYDHSPLYYLYIIVPVLNKLPFKDLGFAPRTNAGALFFIFAISLLVLLRKGAKDAKVEKVWNDVKFGNILPCAVAGIASVLYLMFGSDSFLSYSPMENLNRLMIPVMLFFILAVSLAVSTIRSRRYRALAFAAIVIANTAVALYYINALSPFFTRYDAQYSAAATFNRHFPGIDTSQYTLYYNFSATPQTPCFVLKTIPTNCLQLINTTGVNFSASKTIFLLRGPLPGNMVPYYYNSTYGYYVYVNS